MKKIVIALTLSIASLSLTACSRLNNQEVDSMPGCGLGMGTLENAYLGGQIGRSLDQRDRAHMSHTFETNAIGQPTYWRNNHTGVRYTLVPVRNIAIGGNPYCREYRFSAVMVGKHQEIYGTTCRQPNGSWHIINGN